MLVKITPLLEFLAADIGNVAQGIRRFADREVGRYRLVVLERPVTGVEVVNPPPPRGWQMLAALSADLLFAGALVAVGLLSRALALRRAVPPLAEPHGSSEEPR